MLFNSFEFLFVFLPVVLVGFAAATRVGMRAAAGWLTIASLFFYGWWDVRFLLLLLGSIVFNFACGTRLSRRASNPSWLLTAAVGANLLLLGVCKYTNFVLTAVSDLFGWAAPSIAVALPLGISFYTFTQIAFLVDAARGEAREYRLSRYVLFVTWFPHLIAGPILHHRQLMPQFATAAIYRLSSPNIVRGLALFVLGLTKKVWLADGLAPLAQNGFAAASAGQLLSATDSWVAVLAFSFQLYFDFSGYSDMALGLSALFNVDLPMNFDSPYKASNIADFWRRWHMTLSQFLRDYVYIPLGGSRQGPRRRYVNLGLTMVLGGLWHGANWTFIVWGAWHGALLMVYHAWRAARPSLGLADRRAGRGTAVASTALTFAAVVVGWVFFRADSLNGALHMLAAMAGRMEIGALPSVEVLWPLLGSGIIVFTLPNTNELVAFTRRHADADGWPGWLARGALGPVGGVVLGLLLMACVARLTVSSSEFLYYEF